MKQREAELIKAAETQTAKLSAEVDALKSDLQRLAGSTADLSKAATLSSAEGESLRAELERSKAELAEAVTEGNSKYNAMIAERMQVHLHRLACGWWWRWR